MAIPNFSNTDQSKVNNVIQVQSAFLGVFVCKLIFYLLPWENHSFSPPFGRICGFAFSNHGNSPENLRIITVVKISVPESTLTALP